MKSLVPTSKKRENNTKDITEKAMLSKLQHWIMSECIMKNKSERNSGE